MKHDKNVFGCKTDQWIYQWILHWNIQIQQYCFYLLMHEIEIQKIASFSDIQFSTKNLLLFRCSVCKYSIWNTVNESASYTMENELIKNVRPTLWGLFWVLFEEEEGKFTTFVVSQELQKVWIIFHAWNHDSCHGYRTTKKILE